MELVSKTNQTATIGTEKFFMAPTETSTAIIKVFFLLGFGRDGRKVLKPYKALRIQRSVQLGVPETTAAFCRQAMGVLAPGCSENQRGATSSTTVVSVPIAHLSSSAGCQSGSTWVTCAHSLPGLESGFLPSVQHLNLSFLLLPILELVKTFFPHSTPSEAAKPR